MTASHGAADTADAMTDPRPRVTNRIGNAQQTSVVSAEASPITELSRSGRMYPSAQLTRGVNWRRERIRSEGRFGGNAAGSEGDQAASGRSGRSKVQRTNGGSASHSNGGSRKSRQSRMSPWTVATARRPRSTDQPTVDPDTRASPSCSTPSDRSRDGCQPAQSTAATLPASRSAVSTKRGEASNHLRRSCARPLRGVKRQKTRRLSGARNEAARRSLLAPPRQ